VDGVREVIGWLFIVPGAILCVIGGIGLLRFPEFYSRMHAAGVTDTLGAALVLLGLMSQSADWTVALKLVVILFFLYVTSPTAAHALIHAAYSSGHEPLLADDGPAVPPVLGGDTP
jgi:multicomponent Na+:H+ antiporter subunit G